MGCSGVDADAADAALCCVLPKSDDATGEGCGLGGSAGAKENCAGLLAGGDALKAGKGAGGVKANDIGPFEGGAEPSAAGAAAGWLGANGFGFTAAPSEGAFPGAAAAVNMENALGVAGCAAGRGAEAAGAAAAFVSA